MNRDPTFNEVIQAIRAYHAGRGPTPDEALDRFGKEKVLAVMERLANSGFIEYEDDIRTARIVGEGDAKEE